MLQKLLRQSYAKYDDESSAIPLNAHLQDFTKIQKAYDTDSQEKKTKLINALQNTPFIRAEKPDSDGNNYFLPDQLYFGNDDLRLYFEGNPSYGFVDLDFYPQSAEELFTELGVMNSVRVEKKERNYLGYISIRSYFGDRKRGHDGFDPDIKVDGLEHALNNLTDKKSGFIWNHIAIPNVECIKGIVEKSTRKDFEPSTQSEEISGSFGQLLIDIKWLPDVNGVMHHPSEISMGDLPISFIRNEQLASKFGMPPSMDQIIDIASSALGVSSDILSGIMDASPEQLAQIKSLLNEPSGDILTEVPRPKNVSFPVSRAPYPERREKTIIAEMENAPYQKYVKEVRSVRTSEPEDDQREWLSQQYKNDNDQVVCQICQDEMPFTIHNRTIQNRKEYHFDAVEMLQDYFTKEHAAQFLALCPVCSRKYRTALKQDPDAMETLVDNLNNADSLGNYIVTLKLGDEERSLRFVETHWFDIKTILSYYAQQSNSIPEKSVLNEEQLEPQTGESPQPDK